MIRARRVIVGVVWLLAGGLLAAGPAAGAPIPYPRDQKIDAICADRSVTLLPAPGIGTFSPYFVLGTKQVLIPYQVRFDVETELDIKSRHDFGTVGTTLTKPGPVPAGALTCELSGEFVLDGETVHFTATIVGLLK